MLFRTIVSAFFMPAFPGGDLAALTERAGMTDIEELDEVWRSALGHSDPDRRVVLGSWGAFGKTWAIADTVDQLLCLQLYSSAAEYHDASRLARQADASNRDWPLQAHVDTVCDACLALKPRVAFLDTHPHYEDEAWVNKEGSRTFVLAQAPLVAANDADALAARHFSLLYLDPEMSARLTDHPPRVDRDTVEMQVGTLMFARSGPTRMA